MTPLEIYQQQIATHNTELKKSERQSSLLGWLRLFSMILFLVSLVLTWKGFMIFIPLAVIFISLFFFLLAKHLNTNDQIENRKRLLTINQTEINVLNHHFTDLPDGETFKPEHHEYAEDLDIFGRASLFQYINRCTSEQGNKLFAYWFLNPASTETILERQEAVKELSQQFEWRQQLRSYGMAKPLKVLTENHIDDWLEEPDQFINRSYWHLLRFILPGISIGLLVLHITGIIESNIFYPAILLMLMASLGVSK